MNYKAKRILVALRMQVGKEKFDKKDFRYADFRNTCFVGADFNGADFKRADFRNTDFFCASFKNANFENTDFVNASFWSACLRNTDFENANFFGTDLFGADFKRADFENANFQNTNFFGARLKYADFKYANFNGAKFLGIKGMPKTYNFEKVQKNGLLKIRCEEKHINDWFIWLNTTEEFSTPRSLPLFRQIKYNILKNYREYEL